MALFLIPPALKGVASFIAANGARQATKKYGPKVVKKAQEAIKKREASINTSADKATTQAMKNANLKGGTKNQRIQNMADEMFGTDEQIKNIGRMTKKRGGKATRSTYNKGGYAKSRQPMYGHGECPKAKAN
jgi:hypothetical protein